MMIILFFWAGVAVGAIGLWQLINFGAKCHDKGYEKGKQDAGLRIEEVNVVVATKGKEV